MSDLTFPATLKPIVNKGYSQKRGGNIWRSDVQGGLPRQGRDTYYDAVPVGITLVCNAFDRLMFWTFIQQVDGGASSFQMNLDTGAGIEPHNVQITSDIDDSTQNGIWWNIQFTATAERTSVQDQSDTNDTLLELYREYGRDTVKFINAYEQYCTTPLFINNLPEPL